MMPQQMQMPPMPPGFSMANFMPRMFLIFIYVWILYRKFRSSFNGWFSIHGTANRFFVNSI
jgi:cell shape-determining protein MreD